MEIMGLMVIVVLIAISIFFMVSFRSNNQPTTIKKDYSDTQLGTNFILAILKVDTECQGLNIEELIKDCATQNRVSCSGISGCEYLNQSIDFLLNKTLYNMSTRFNFTIEKAKIPISFANECEMSDESTTTGFQPIPLYPLRNDNAFVKLKICKS
ncbi:MAG: hypothetical protein ABIC91_01365 [Nanoarchaeota archaeon]|nr:hypothetical protein [Nanoarchaeota archaeon]MBU1029870.1 hypothetical protein [Nanoarchaeota archaeon]